MGNFRGRDAIMQRPGVFMLGYLGSTRILFVVGCDEEVCGKLFDVEVVVVVWLGCCWRRSGMF